MVPLRTTISGCFSATSRKEFGQLVSTFLELVGVTEVDVLVKRQKWYNRSSFEDIVTDEVAGPGAHLS